MKLSSNRGTRPSLNANSAPLLFSGAHIIGLGNSFVNIPAFRQPSQGAIDPNSLAVNWHLLGCSTQTRAGSSMTDVCHDFIHVIIMYPVL